METDDSVPFRTEFWGVCCESGKKYSQVVQEKFRVTKAVLESPVKGTSDTVSLMVERGDSQYLLCHLKPENLLQADLNLYFDKGEKISFLIKGRGKIHLSGYHIYGKTDLFESSEKSSSLFPIKKGNISEKKACKSNLKTVDSDDSEDDSSEENSTNTPTKAVATSATKASTSNKKTEKDDDESDDDDPFAELESSEEESGEEEEIKKDARKLQAGKRLFSSLSQDDDDEESDESDSDDDTDDEDVSKRKAKLFQEKKKMKKDSPMVSSAKNTPNVQKKLAKVISIDDDSSATLNSSIGRTPMPKKKKPLNANQGNSSFQQLNLATADAKHSISNSDIKTSSMSASPTKKEDMNITVPLSESKKKKKKKKKFIEGLNTSNDMEKDTSKVSKTGLPSASYSQKLPSGLEYEDIRVGNGPIAKKGRIVHVYYTGMLENNKIFDSCEANSRPFSFKLGSHHVIRGWELGIEGMKVGGKRRLKIPANLGYKNQRMNSIPPNSTLYFNVELKAVS